MPEGTGARGETGGETGQKAIYDPPLVVNPCWHCSVRRVRRVKGGPQAQGEAGPLTRRARPIRWGLAKPAALCRLGSAQQGLRFTVRCAGSVAWHQGAGSAVRQSIRSDPRNADRHDGSEARRGSYKTCGLALLGPLPLPDCPRRALPPCRHRSLHASCAPQKFFMLLGLVQAPSPAANSRRPGAGWPSTRARAWPPQLRWPCWDAVGPPVR